MAPDGVRIALLGSLTTTKVDPKDVDLLLFVEDTLDLASLATAGRKLQGRITSLTHGNYGADLFVASSRQRYLGCKSHNETGGGVQLSWWLLAFPVFCPSCLRSRTNYLSSSKSVAPLTRIIILLPPVSLWDLHIGAGGQLCTRV